MWPTCGFMQHQIIHINENRRCHDVKSVMMSRRQLNPWGMKCIGDIKSFSNVSLSSLSNFKVCSMFIENIFRNLYLIIPFLLLLHFLLFFFCVSFNSASVVVTQLIVVDVLIFQGETLAQIFYTHYVEERFSLFFSESTFPL